ncbi:NAF1 protein, partial [Onychorhynchus coronatus]|nr:NAF1 protein [Onychorhynchus coronatus]
RRITDLTVLEQKMSYLLIDSLICKEKATHTNKAKQINSPLPMDRQVFSHAQESWTPSHATLGHTNAITPNVLFLLLPPALYAEHDAIWYGISFWSLWVSCPGCVPSRLFCTPSFLADGELPPVEDLSIILPDNVELRLFGTVSSIIEQLVVIESLRGLPPVNEDSVIFKEDRQAAGKIFEVFGPVLHPFYVLRFNSSEHIKEKGINVQDSMYFAPAVEDFTQYIFTEELKKEKGSDASWKHDQEPPPEALDFSDDEKEREAKQKKKKPESEGRKKLRSETIPSSANKGFHPSMQQPASRYSRGYRGRGFSRHSLHPPSVPRGFWRAQVRPPQLYSSDRRIHQESPVFPQPFRKEYAMMQQYPCPPPVFGSVSGMHQFPRPLSNTNWAGPNVCSSSYTFLPPAPPPPPPPSNTDSHPSQFRPY